MEDAENLGTSFRWVKPWNSGLDRAYSYDTQIPYKGVNRLLLENDEYLTFNKMQEINQQKGTPEYQIRKGARSNIVCYYNITPIKDEQTGEPMIDEYTGKELKRGFLKYYRVFSKGDIVRKDNGESLPSKFNFEHFSHEDATEQMQQALDRFNRLFNYYCKKNGIEVQVVQDGTQAYFSHNMKIRVPDISNFNSIYNWVHTVAHEMAHSTGMFLGRFKDQEPKAIEEAKKSYSKEELAAEITAEMLCSVLHIPDDSETPDNAVAYIHSWSSYLKDRPNEIVSAAAKAESACEMIMECLREMELEEQKVLNEHTEEER
jgi:antirestriction protein ArdC